MFKPMMVSLLAAAMVNGSALSDAADALGPGDTVSFTKELTMSSYDYAWQTRGHFDAKNQLAHVMGKPANNNTAWKHAVYDVAADRWAYAYNIGWDIGGHIYGNFGMDPATGDLFQAAQKRVYRYDSELKTWSEITAIYNYITSLSSWITYQNGVAWHPSMFGEGDGALVVQGGSSTLYWRKSTNVVYRVQSVRVGDNAGDAIYFAAINKVITGRDRHVISSPNSGGIPIVDTLDTPPPIRTGGLPIPVGNMVQHPTIPEKIMLLERDGDVGGRRVWESTDGATWTLADYIHPFEGGAVRISIPEHGVIWGVGYINNTRFSILWKPHNTPASSMKSIGLRPEWQLTTQPNPFNSKVTISFKDGSFGPHSGLAASVSIYDVTGKVLNKIVQGGPGNRFVWDASGMPAGAYTIRAVSGSKSLTKKIVLQK